MDIASLLLWLGNLVLLAVPSAGLVFVFFRWFGKQWIERLLSRDLEKFKREQQEKLEGYKSEQQKELERLRHLLTSRVSKIHDKEFEVLPKAWLMLNDLHGSVMQAIDLTMKFVPDFATFSAAKLEALLTTDPSTKRLTEYQKTQLRSIEGAEEKNKYYRDTMRAHDIDEATEKERVFRNYLIEHRIFMTDELRSKFTAAQDTLSSALIRYSIGKSAGDFKLVLAAQEEMLASDIKALVDGVEKAVQMRLHYDEAA